VHDNDAADSEWSRIAELVRDAKEEALQACADLDIPPELVVEGCEIVWEFRTLTDAGDAETIPDNEIAALREKAVRRVATAIDLPEVVVLGSAEEIRASAYTPPHDTNGEP
jgi:hypothetical protein